MAEKELVKVSFNLPAKELEFLREVAEKRGINVTQALRRAIAAEQLIEEVEASDAKLLLEKGSTTREVMIR